MKNKKTGKILLLAGLIVVLIAVGYINYAIGNNNTDDMASNTNDLNVDGAMQSDDLAVMSSESFFEDYKTQRQSTRDSEVAVLDSIIDNENSDAETIKDAQERKIEIVEAMESELTIEGLLASTGFVDAIVTVQTGSVNVVLKASEISKEEAAQILEIVRQETDEPAQNIKVILQD